MAESNHITRLFESRHVHDTLTSHGTTWKFIPKRAPWYGGWWERLIGLTKPALKKTLGRTYVTYADVQNENHLHQLIFYMVDALLHYRIMTLLMKQT